MREAKMPPEFVVWVKDLSGAYPGWVRFTSMMDLVEETRLRSKGNHAAVERRREIRDIIAAGGGILRNRWVFTTQKPSSEEKFVSKWKDRSSVKSLLPRPVVTPGGARAKA